MIKRIALPGHVIVTGTLEAYSGEEDPRNSRVVTEVSLLRASDSLRPLTIAEIPLDVTGTPTIKAYPKRLQLDWNPVNNAVSYFVEVSSDSGSTWLMDYSCSSNRLDLAIETSVTPAAVALYRFRVKARSLYDYLSDGWATSGAPSVVEYGTYSLVAPSVTFTVAKRTLSAIIAPQVGLNNASGWDVQISRLGGVDANWYKPNPAAKTDADGWYTGSATDYLTVKDPSFRLMYLPIPCTDGLPDVAGQIYYLRVRALCSDPAAVGPWETSSGLTVLALLGVDIAASQVTTALIAANAVDISKMATGLRPPRVVASLPANPYTGYLVGDTCVLTTDKKLYRLTDLALPTTTGWSKAVDGADLIADSVTAAAVLAGSIGTDELAAGSVTTERLNVQSLKISPEGLTIYNSFDNIGVPDGPARIRMTPTNRLLCFSVLNCTQAATPNDLSAIRVTATTADPMLFYTPPTLLNLSFGGFLYFRLRKIVAANLDGNVGIFFRVGGGYVSFKSTTGNSTLAADIAALPINTWGTFRVTLPVTYADYNSIRFDIVATIGDVYDIADLYVGGGEYGFSTAKKTWLRECNFVAADLHASSVSATQYGFYENGAWAPSKLSIVGGMIQVYPAYANNILRINIAAGAKYVRYYLFLLAETTLTINADSTSYTQVVPANRWTLLSCLLAAGGGVVCDIENFPVNYSYICYHYIGDDPEYAGIPQDNSGLLNHLTWCKYVVPSPGVSGNALRFDGIKAHAVGSPILSSPSLYSAVFWVYLSGVANVDTNAQTVFELGVNDASGIWAYFDGTVTNPQLYIRFNRAGNHDTVTTGIYTDSGAWNCFVITVNCTTKAWVVYKNGVWAAGGTLTNTPLAPTGTLRLGCGVAYNTWLLNGQIDEFRFYSRVLEINEVLCLYQNPGGPHKGIITADEIYVKDLSAINANLGIVKAGILQSYDYIENVSGFIIDLDDAIIKCGDGTWKIEGDGSTTLVGAKVKTSDGRLLINNLANTDNSFEGLCVSGVPINESSPENGFVMQFSGYNGIIGGYYPGITWNYYYSGVKTQYGRVGLNPAGDMQIQDALKGLTLQFGSVSSENFIFYNSVNPSVIQVDRVIADEYHGHTMLGISSADCLDKGAASQTTYAEIWGILSPKIPSNYDTMVIHGGWKDGGGSGTFHLAKRVDASTIHLFLSTGWKVITNAATNWHSSVSNYFVLYC